MSRDPAPRPCVDCGAPWASFGFGPLFPLSAALWRCQPCAEASGLFPELTERRAA